MSKSHPEQWAINEVDTSGAEDLVRALAEFPTTQIADAGAPISVVGPGIVPVAGGNEICGTAVTVWVKPGDILYILKAAEFARPGSVLVVDAGGRLDAAVVGDFFAGSVAKGGGVGIIVDGVVRDVDGIDEIGIPTFARGTYPTTASNEGPGAINIGIQLGGVRVEPGDIIRADRNGCVVIPRRHAEETLRLTREVAARETAWQREIEAGKTLASGTGVDAVLAQRLRGEDEQVHLP